MASSGGGQEAARRAPFNLSLVVSYRVKVAAEPELAQPRREQSFGDEASFDADEI